MATEQPSNRPNRYRLYIDESGDHAYNRLEHTASRFLGLLGVWFKQPDHYTAFADGLDHFRREIFGPRPDEPVVLHRSDIINRKGPAGILKDPSTRRRFDAGLLKLVSDARCKIVCVVIEKKQHAERYTSPFHPYHYCLAAMLERYAGWLNFYNAVGDVMAEARGKEEDLQLKEAYHTFYEAGTQWFRHEHSQRALTTNKLKLKRKQMNIAGLQLADVLAHPIKQHCLAHKGHIESVRDGFGKELISVAMSKFNKQVYQNRIDGYGRVYL